ncbi:MAG: hypothetical protein ACI8XM_000934 [Haloarculaceae archaeon]|jgi:hypothetical protein
MVESIQPLVNSRSVVLLVTIVFVVAAAVVGLRHRLGPNADWLETVRAAILPLLDPILERTIGIRSEVPADGGRARRLPHR